MRHPETNKLMRVCYAHNYCTKAAQNDKLFRIEDILDIYPEEKRYHNLRTGKKGKYKNIAAFLPAIITRIKDDYNPMLR